jgi:hypothetical protein
VLPDAAQILFETGIDPKRRAETLELDEWFRLSAAAAGKLER